MSDQWSFETKQIHAGQTPDPTTGARALPIYQTTSFQFRDTDHAAALFSLAEPGNIYTRIMNPTQGVVEERLAALEGGVGALLFASGQAATTGALTERRRGRRPHRRLVEPLRRHRQPAAAHASRSSASRSASSPTRTTRSSGAPRPRPNTKAYFGETIGNPKGDVLDLEAISAVAKEVGVPFIVDNTIATPVPAQPAQARRRHRRPLGDEVHRRPRHDDRRCRDRRRHVRLRRARRQVPRVHRARRELSRPRSTPRRSARRPTSPSCACSTCATSAPRSARSAPSCWPRVWRR